MILYNIGISGERRKPKQTVKSATMSKGFYFWFHFFSGLIGLQLNVFTNKSFNYLFKL